MTRGGIAKDLHYSPYSHKLKNLIFYFSSKNYKHKFVTALANYTDDFRLALEKKISLSLIGCEDIATILLYKRIEKRGFYIEQEKHITKDNINIIKYNSMDEIFIDMNIKVCKKGLLRGD